jgi:predicted Zn-dependent protease
LNNNTAKAIALCETVLKVSPQNFKADILLAQLYATSNPQRAFELAKAAYQLKPDDMQVCATLGRMAFLNGNDRWAYNLLEQASQNQPDNAQTSYDFANAAFCLGKISDAQTAMQNALQAGLPDPESTDAKVFLDLVALCQNPEQAVVAESHVENVLSSNPNNAPALFADAVIDMQNRNPFGAESLYEKLLAAHPDCTLAQKNLAILYAQNLVEPDKAYPVAVKARESFPDDPQVAKALGLILFQQGNYVRATDLLNTISDSNAADAELFYCLGISEFRLKNYTTSRKSLQHALNLNLSGQQATDARQTLAELNN